VSEGWPIDPLTGQPFDWSTHFARLRDERERREAERVITEGSLQRFLLCTASFGIAYPNPLIG
jgi:hypothetical protein